MKGTLYVVATPIGNLEDMTFRAVRVLAEANLIAAEDTRQTRKLLTRYEIKTPTVSCHKFNEAERVSFFIEALASGKNVALVSDAGTPCVADPGGRLVAKAADAGFEVIPVCGASAVAAALSVSGFEISSYAFLGFLPRTEKLLVEKLSEANDREAIIFYESPKRITKTLCAIIKNFPESNICLCNDLTKKFEKIYRGDPEKILAELEANPDAEKGEYTCVAKMKIRKAEEAEARLFSLEAQLVNIMFEKSVTLREASRLLHDTKKKSPTKKEIYAASLRLKELFNA